jgi:hypothetical protein
MQRYVKFASVDASSSCSDSSTAALSVCKVVVATTVQLHNQTAVVFARKDNTSCASIRCLLRKERAVAVAAAAFACYCMLQCTKLRSSSSVTHTHH